MSISNLLKTKKIIPIGRTYINDDMMFMNFSGSGFKCQSDTDLRLVFKATKYDSKTECPYITIFVDGKRTDYALDEEFKTIIIQNNKLSKIEVVKRTETSVSHTALYQINGVLYELYEEKKLNIEFYGDSLTCGFGNLATNPSESFTTETESFVDGFAFLTAKKLNANYSAICVSGFPVYKSRWNQGFPVDSVADMISFSDYKEDMTFETVNHWDNKKFQPDVVVINLGTNDDSYFTPGQDWIDELMKEKTFDEVKKTIEFKQRFEALEKRIQKFIKDLLLVYGENIKIIWVLKC